MGFFMKKMVRGAVIVAGGIGKRMGSVKPKQFMSLGDCPVMVHSIRKFLAVLAPENIVLVMAEAFHSDWRALQITYPELAKVHVISGGKERFDSVKNGLKALPLAIKVVAVHDAVRPLVTAGLIEKCFALAEDKGSAVPVIHLRDSLRKMEGSESLAADRQEYRLVQTPQCFDLKRLKDAYAMNFSAHITDDASVWEAAGHKVELTEGEESNVKITLASDLLWAECLLHQG